MEYIKNRFYEKASKCISEYQRLRKEYGDKVIASVTLEQVMSGMKGVPSLITDTSKLDPQEGIRFRGYSIPEIREKLPPFSFGRRTAAGRLVLPDADWRNTRTRRRDETSAKTGQPDLRFPSMFSM